MIKKILVGCKASVVLPSLLLLSGAAAWASPTACSTATSTAPAALPYGSATIPDSGTTVANDLASLNTAGGCAGVDVNFSNFATATGATTDGTYIYNGSGGTPDDSLTFSSIRGDATVLIDDDPNDGNVNYHGNSASTTAEVGFVVDSGSTDNVANMFTLVLSNYITNNKDTGNTAGIDFTVNFCVGGTLASPVGITNTSCTSGGGVFETFSIPRVGANITTPTSSTYTFTLVNSAPTIWVDNLMNLNGTGSGSLGTNLMTFTDSFDTPEPSAFVLCGLGLIGLIFLRFRRKQDSVA